MCRQRGGGGTHENTVMRLLSRGAHGLGCDTHY